MIFTFFRIPYCFFNSNELLGLEGMVKIKNPDESLLNGNQTVRSSEIDITALANEITDSRR